jgi:hypothetical protein
MHPASATQSFAYGTDGTTQVGEAIVDSESHASKWNGTAGSWVDLHPAGMNASIAYASDGATQIGTAFLLDKGGKPTQHAGLWNGTAASWVDLHPTKAGSFSHAFGGHGGQQVGMANIDKTGFTAASLWTGTAGSWVDLSPAGTGSSVARAAHDGVQVGAAYVGNDQHAGLWTGSAASWVDLHTFVPGDYSRSIAYGVWSDAGLTYVVGTGYNPISGEDEALLWTMVPEPASYLFVGIGLAALFRRKRVR